MTIKKDLMIAEAKGFVKALLRLSGYLVNLDTKIEIRLTNIRYRTEDGECSKIEIRISDPDMTLHYGNTNPVIIEDDKSIEECLAKNMLLHPETMWLEEIKKHK